MKLAAAMGTIYLVWGSTYFAIATADKSMPPLLMLAVRFAIAGALLYAWCWKRGVVREARLGRRDWRNAAIVGGLLLVIDTGGVALAEQHVASGLTAVLIATVPLFMAILDRIVLGVRLPLPAAAGILAGLVGVGVLVGPHGSVNALGAVIILVAAFAWAAGSLYARVARLPENTLLAAAMQMISAGVLLGIAGLALGEGSHVRMPSAASLGAFLFLIVFGSIVAFTVYGWLLRKMATSLLSTYAYVNPAVAVGLGWAFAGEHVGGRELAAGFVILASVGLLFTSRAALRSRNDELQPAPAEAAHGRAVS